MHAAIYGRHLHKDDIPFLQKFFDLLDNNKISYVIENNFLKKLNPHIHFSNTSLTFQSHVDIRNNTDCLFSLGGDGTMLDTVALVRDSNIPVMGINIGRLGFLASIGREQIEDAVQALINKQYTLENRTLVHIDTEQKIFGEVNYGLNDFTIHKKDTSAMNVIHAKVNGELMASYWADGLIVATPTGSTAYNLSCGGPILAPDSGSFVITPIASHNLSLRPLVVSDNSVISLEVHGRSENFLANLDSRTVSVDSSCKFEVRKEKFPIRLIQLNNMNFLSTLRAKLNWGIDKRN